MQSKLLTEHNANNTIAKLDCIENVTFVFANEFQIWKQREKKKKKKTLMMKIIILFW